MMVRTPLATSAAPSHTCASRRVALYALVLWRLRVGTAGQRDELASTSVGQAHCKNANRAKDSGLTAGIPIRARLSHPGAQRWRATMNVAPAILAPRYASASAAAQALCLPSSFGGNADRDTSEAGSRADNRATPQSEGKRDIPMKSRSTGRKRSAQLGKRRPTTTASSR